MPWKPWENHPKPWENHGETGRQSSKTMGKQWKNCETIIQNHGKTMAKLLEKSSKTIKPWRNCGNNHPKSPAIRCLGDSIRSYLAGSLLNRELINLYGIYGYTHGSFCRPSVHHWILIWEFHTAVPHVLCENPLFQWQCSIANCYSHYQRVQHH